MVGASDFDRFVGRAITFLADLERSDPVGAGTWRAVSNRRLVELFERICTEVGARSMIECGAFEASASTRFVRAGSDRRAVAVEANPFTHRLVTMRAEAAGVETVNAGLGSQAGRMTLHIPAGSASDPTPTPRQSSFRRRTGVVAGGERSVEVDVTTIDAVIDQRALLSPLALWVDVEGMAGEVLRGGERTLRTMVAVALVEVELASRWQDQELEQDVIALLATFGLVPAACDFERPAQRNVLFVRPDLLGTDAIRDFTRVVLRRPSIRARALSWTHLLRRSVRVHGASAVKALLGEERGYRYRAALRAWTVTQRHGRRAD